MQVKVEIPEEWAAKARARGVSLEVYVQEILAQQIQSAHESVDSVSQAIDRIRELRKGNKLDGIRLKDLIHEGHKH